MFFYVGGEEVGWVWDGEVTSVNFPRSGVQGPALLQGCMRMHARRWVDVVPRTKVSRRPPTRDKERCAHAATRTTLTWGYPAPHGLILWENGATPLRIFFSYLLGIKVHFLILNRCGIAPSG